MFHYCWNLHEDLLDADTRGLVRQYMIMIFMDELLNFPGCKYDYWTRQEVIDMAAKMRFFEYLIGTGAISTKHIIISPSLLNSEWPPARDYFIERASEISNTCVPSISVNEYMEQINFAWNLGRRTYEDCFTMMIDIDMLKLTELRNIARRLQNIYLRLTGRLTRAQYFIQ